MAQGSSIVLCGFMGCGKSTVGGFLARRLQYGFLDLDAYIEERQRLSIPEIFAQQGEEAFRAMETEALTALFCTAQASEGATALRANVIAAGGGALLRTENARLIHSGGGRIVFLHCGFDVCCRRIENSDRPLVRRNTRQELGLLFERRIALYRAACDYEVSAEALPEQVSDTICVALASDKKYTLSL